MNNFEVVLKMIETDPHVFGTRPCSTCLAITELVARPFGCIKKLRTRSGSEQDYFVEPQAACLAACWGGIRPGGMIKINSLGFCVKCGCEWKPQ